MTYCLVPASSAPLVSGRASMQPHGCYRFDWAHIDVIMESPHYEMWIIRMIALAYASAEGTSRDLLDARWRRMQQELEGA